MTDLDRNALEQTLTQWLAIDSTSGLEKAFLEHLEQAFGDDRWNITRQSISDDRWNLIIDDGHPTRLLYSTHVDTVPPTLPVRVEDGVVFGRGACDTKGGLLAMWKAAQILRRQNHKGIGFLLVVGEEVDHLGARLAQDLSLSPAQIILCEPTINRVVQAQKGMVRFTLRAEGVAGHSAFPGDGRSAVAPLLDGLQKLRHHRWPTSDRLGPTTLNIGILQAGVAANVFAPHARAEILLRAVSDVTPIIETIHHLAGDELLVEDLVFNDPIFFDVPDEVPTCTVPFNTDATYLQTLGPVWLVGPGDIRCAHSDDERISIDALTAGVDLYLDLGQRVLHTP